MSASSAPRNDDIVHVPNNMVDSELFLAPQLNFGKMVISPQQIKQKVPAKGNAKRASTRVIASVVGAGVSALTFGCAWSKYDPITMIAKVNLTFR